MDKEECYNEACEQIGIYANDLEEYGDTYIKTGEYLVNEEEVNELAEQYSKEQKGD